jgi:hypothetical protein
MTLMTTKRYRSVEHMTLFCVLELQASCSNFFCYIETFFTNELFMGESTSCYVAQCLTSSYQLVPSLRDKKAKTVKMLNLHTQLMTLAEVEAPYMENPKLNV